MGMEITTTCCGHKFDRPTEWPSRLKGATFDCPGCGDLRVFTDNDGSNKNLHEYLHARDPRWPKEGANTDYIEVSD
jgi:hypothetical protein